MRHIYSAIFYIALPFLLLRLWRRGKAAPAYRKRWRERFGLIEKPQGDTPTLWFHTVSVGEFIAARPLIQHYLDTGNYDIVVTTTTPTGSDRVRDVFGDAVFHCYCPYDTPLFVKRFLNKIKPVIFVCLETELWPNIIHFCSQKKIPIIVANARLSEKSARGYAHLRALSSPMLNKISIAAIQNDTDADRFLQLGLKKSSRHVTGSIKFDLKIDDTTRETADALKHAINAERKTLIWIAASTHSGEDEIILHAYTMIRKKHKHVYLILVPRHPERFDQVHKLCVNSGFNTIRRSQNNDQDFDIMVGDTMGELLMLLGVADIAFIGGSLVSNGGHNYIEPAAWGLPIISGPSTYNFLTIANELRDAGALTITPDAQAISQEVIKILENPDRARTQGNAAKQIAEKNRGAMKKLIELIDANIH